MGGMAVKYGAACRRVSTVDQLVEQLVDVCEGTARWARLILLEQTVGDDDVERILGELIAGLRTQVQTARVCTIMAALPPATVTRQVSRVP